MRSIRTKHGRGWAVGLVVAGLLAGGCSDEAADRPRPVSGSPTTSAGESASSSGSTGTSTSEPATDERTSTTTAPADGAVGRELAEGDPLRAEIETAYRNAIEAFIAAAAIPDPAFAALTEWTTGAMREGWTNDLAAMRIQGRAGRYSTDSIRRIEVLRVNDYGQSAVVESCDLDDGVLVEVASGRIVNDQVTLRKKRSVVRLEVGRWRLSDRDDLGDEESATCSES